MNKKTVLVVDGGGRGAVLVQQYSLSSKVGKILAIPGNDLMQINSHVPVKTYQHLTTTSVKEIVEIAKKEKVDLVDVNQDNAVEVGLVDALAQAGVVVVGPTRAAGQIEWDKAWARDFMKRYKIPHPKYKVCRSEKEGVSFIKQQKEGRWFIKASGLAYGKGALPAETNSEAIERIKQMKKFGKSGETYVIEEWLDGEEFSLFAFCDGNTYKIVGGAQDHKRMYDHDQGDNTGGIGCSSPPLVLTPKILRQTEAKIIKPTIDGLKKEGRDYKGVLYLGGILVKNKPYVIEFNARWGDPEPEVILPGLKGDLFEISQAMANSSLKKISPKLDGLSRVVVSISLHEHPVGKPEKNGWPIYGIDQAAKIKGVSLYGARVRKINGRHFAGSGRLLHITGVGRNVIEAREKAYQAAALIFIKGNNQHYRTDIGWRDVERLRSGHQN